MKKIAKILFTFMIMVVGLFGMGNVNAQELQVKYITEAYEVGLIGTDKFDVNVITSENDIINKAIAKFYPESSGAQVVHAVPFKFTLNEGQTWDANTDKATMYVRIPNDLLHAAGDYSKTYIIRINPTNNTNKQKSYEIKDYESLKKIPGNESVSTEKPIQIGSGNQNYFTDNYAVLETSDFDATGTTYYMLVVCNPTGVQQPPTTTTTTTTTIKPVDPTTTTTTTIENPKTADMGNQLYIVLGVICFAGIVSLGAKFAKSSK